MMPENRQDLVSVIVPVYNIEAYVQDCVRSLQTQSHKAIEIWLVDDGSTDQSGRLCDRLAQEDARIHVIHQENQGQGAARNRGIEACRGRYVLFVDGDDVLAEDGVDRLLSLTKGEDGIIGCCQLCHYSEDREPKYIREGGSERLTAMQAEEALMYQRQMMETTVCGRLFPRALFMDTGIRFPNIYYEDLATVYRLYQASAGVCCTKDELYGYRQRSTGTMLGGFTDKKGQDILSAVEMIQKDYASAGRKRRRAAVCRCFCALCNVFMSIPEREYDALRRKIWQTMLECRWAALFNGKASKKAMLGALLTYTGEARMRWAYRKLKEMK